MRITLGVGGGIAAYKAAELARLLISRGHSVRAVLTRAACEFITPLTFTTLTGQSAITDLFPASNDSRATLASAVEHIGVASETDLLLIAPATANLCAEFAHGLAGDFLTTTYLAFRGPVVLAPAMNTNMWEHPATQANLAILRERGHQIVEPEEGLLACGVTGPGRLPDPVIIADAVERWANPVCDLAGETILITAGPTEEPIDPVRFLSNRSSGKMGYALAEAAAARGAHVILVSGPVSLPVPGGVTRISVRTVEEMRTAVFASLDSATIVIKCAAVADFRPAHAFDHKLKKNGASLSLELEPTPDILAELGRRKGDRLLIGFAAETSDLETEARRKLEYKNCDMVVGNLVAESDSVFGSDWNEVSIVTRAGAVHIPRAPKRDIAERILREAVKLRSPLAAAHAY